MLLIEDYRLLQAGILTMLHSYGEFDVVARFEEDDAARQLQSLGLRPDVVLLDLDYHNKSSLALMALLRLEIPAARIVAMDVRPIRVNIMEFVRAGGHALILKNTPASGWCSTLMAVEQGDNAVSPLPARSGVKRITTGSSSGSSDIAADKEQLTTREHEIVTLIAEGLSNKEIAGLLHIASYALMSHIHTILEKLTFDTGLQIAAYIRSKNS